MRSLPRPFRSLPRSIRETLAPYSSYDIALIVGFVAALLFVGVDMLDGRGFDADTWYVLLGQSVAFVVAVYGAYGFVFKQGEFSLAVQEKK